MYTRQQLLNYGKQYVLNTKQIPAAKKFTKAAGYCSRDWIYKEFGSWPNYLKELGFEENNQQEITNNKNKYKFFNRDHKVKIVIFIEAPIYKFLFSENIFYYLANKYLEDNYIIWPKTKVNKNDYIKALWLKGSIYNILNVNKNTITNINKKVFPNIQSLTIKTHILNFYNKNYCCICDTIKNIEEFYSNKSRYNNIATNCIACYKLYQKNNIEKWIYNNYKRNKRVPNWGQKGIKEFYENCPIGYQVDHIIPLNGKYVSGLHIINNLQYLLEKDNKSKNNYHESEEYWK